jgi:hypothetical protein
VRLLLASVLVVQAAPRAEFKPATYVKCSVRQGRAGKLDWRLRPYNARPLHRQLDRVFWGTEAEAIGALAAFAAELDEQVNRMARTLTAGAESGP